MSSRIGILGGTFDPIHKGHLKLAAAAKKHLALDRVYFVPTYRTPLKSRHATSARHRVRMIRLAIRGVPYARVSLFEIERRHVSYTIHTAKHFRRRFGPHAALFFIAGSDILRRFRQWKDNAYLARFCAFAVTRRAGSGHAALPPGFVPLSMRPVNVSSSVLRRRLARGQKTPQLPAAVRRYVEKHRLYVLG